MFVQVFVHDINDEIQLRSKDNFVQWKKKDSTGKPTTYGIRLKDSRESQRLEGIVGGIIAMLETVPSAAPWPTDSKPQVNKKVNYKQLESFYVTTKSPSSVTNYVHYG